MATVISSVLFTQTDDRGNRWVNGYFLAEFRDALYTPGGENLNLSSFMRRVDHIAAYPASGVLEYQPRPNYGDFPAQAGSGRMQLWYGGSGIVTLNISGALLSITSGQQMFVPVASAVFSTSNTIQAISGRLSLAGSGAFAAGFTPVEILSGTAVSGIRMKIFALGY